MSKGVLIIAHCKEWCDEVFEYSTDLIDQTKYQIYYVRNVVELTKTCENLKQCKIFFVHWSWIVEPSILDNFECICFHMTDLPYGRGGSPLQNLIIRGHTNTKITAIRMTNILDAGPIYSKRSLSLDGSAHEIFVRASKVCIEMALDIVQMNPTPIEQKGEVTVFRRLGKNDNKIDFENADIDKIYDIIRMLDASGYPSAWVEIGQYILEFSNGKKKNGVIEGHYKISQKSQSVK